MPVKIPFAHHQNFVCTDYNSGHQLCVFKSPALDVDIVTLKTEAK